MNSALSEGRFHFVYILKFIRNGLVLCLLPMIRALLRFDLASLYTALKQDAAILAIMAFVSVLLWRRGGFRLVPGRLFLHSGFVSWRRQIIPFSQIAVMEQSRPPWLRLMGATRVTLYSTRSSNFKTRRFYLTKRQAAYMAEQLMPVQSDAVLFHPTGAERIRFMLLSANVAASLALLFVSADQTSELLGSDVSQQLNHLALDNFTRFEQLMELFLPAGLAWLFTLACLLWGLGLFWSLLSTGGFQVSRSGGVILARGGHVNHTERRVRVSSVTACDVRRTPSARLLRRWPVYLIAGNFAGGDIPFLVYKTGQEELLHALLPGVLLEELDPGPVADRSWPLYIWKGGCLFAFSAALTAVSVWQAPPLTPLLFLPLVLSLGLFLAGVEARFHEGIARQAGGELRLCCVRNFTRHDLCVLTPDLGYCTLQTPFSENIGRCTFYLHLPCRRRLRVRGVKSWQARSLKLID